MKAHVVDIQTARVNHDPHYGDCGNCYRWRCSCGEKGDWQVAALSARRGGEQHRQKAKK